MNKLEAQAVIENEGYYDEEEIEDVMKIYDELIKHKGFEDNRRDSRFIVKFHDIFYYLPDEYYKEHADEINCLFDDFCSQEYEFIMDEANIAGIDVDSMLTRHDIGHYQGFMVDIPEITLDNSVELAMKIYDEYNYKGEKYVGDYIKLTKLLQDLEDNYMDYWFNFIDETVDYKTLKEMKENYKRDQEKKGK